MGTFNTYGNKSRKYGGSSPVWLTVSQKERAGGVLAELPPVGTVIKAGTLVHVDGAGGIATIIPTFLVVRTTETSFVLKTSGFKLDGVEGLGYYDSYDNLATFYNLKEDGKITYNKDGSECTIEVESFHSFQEGQILVGGKVSEETGFQALFPTGLTENDVWIDEGDEYATVASVYHGEIMEDRIQPVPASYKKRLPMIKFQKGL